MGVAQFFDGKTIFITGATGFVGKVLIEKLLRSCPGIEKIYVLVRPKKGSSVEERIEKFKELNIFERIKKDNPDVLDKVIGIPGNVSELNLGLSDSDRKLLVDNVNIIYHSAASVRFDDFLEDAIILNVRGTREIAKLALDLKNPTIFVHISTAYSNLHQHELEERLYPSHSNWEDAILLAETCDKDLLHIMTEKYIHPYTNTYTFAKGLGEHVVNDMCKGKIQTIITRPSIVVSSLEEPMPGFNDNFNGPLGLLVIASRGILRSYYLQRLDIALNYVPVDVVIKAIILASYNSTKKTFSDENEVEVYNITELLVNITFGEFLENAIKLNLHHPSPNIVWYPNNKVTKCKYNFYINILLFHLLPSSFLDILLRLIGKKPMVVKIIRKVFTASELLGPFLSVDYIFRNEKMLSMQRNLTEDEEDFRYPNKLNSDETDNVMLTAIDGVSLYILNEPLDPTGESQRRSLRRFWYAHIIVNTIMYVFLIWLLFIKLNLLERFWTYINI